MLPKWQFNQTEAEESRRHTHRQCRGRLWRNLRGASRASTNLRARTGSVRRSLACWAGVWHMLANTGMACVYGFRSQPGSCAGGVYCTQVRRAAPPRLYAMLARSATAARRKTRDAREDESIRAAAHPCSFEGVSERQPMHAQVRVEMRSFAVRRVAVECPRRCRSVTSSGRHSVMRTLASPHRGRSVTTPAVVTLRLRHGIAPSS